MVLHKKEIKEKAS